MKYLWDSSSISDGEFTATFSSGTSAANATVLKFSRRQDTAASNDVTKRWDQLDDAIANGQTAYISYRLSYGNGNLQDMVTWEVTGKSTGNVTNFSGDTTEFVYAVSKAWGQGAISFANYTGRLNLFSIILEGIQGTTGAQGGAGADGAFASIGLQGLQGTQGLQGIQGTVGETGADSTVPGPQGTDGLQGIKGPQGLAGTIGVDGDAGPQGTDGIQGITGVQGNLGFQGTDGAFASQGVQGVTGGAGQAGGVSFALAVALAAAL